MHSENFFKSINTWSDFKESCSGISNKEKGDAFELLTKLYFEINPLYSFYDEVWLLSEVPQKVLEYLGLPSQDLGIDLIAKNDNEYHAIQCKYHSEKRQSVTFKEISTFISLVESNPNFTKGYICSSADLTSKTFDKVKTDKIIKIMSDSWQRLDESFFEKARELIEGKSVKLVPFKPRQHQEKALKDCSTYFNKKSNTKGKLIFPCGAGKSLTGYWMANALQSKSTIIAVPSLALVKQTLEVYLREYVANKRKNKWLCICSDEGIGRNDDVAIYTEDLGVPCVTDPNYIEKWLKDNKDEDKIIFTTYQSGRIIAEISKKLKMTFDVGIFDEAHKTVGSNKKLFSHLLFDENISIDKRIFMTATERFYAGSKDDIISMDDYDIYGDTFAQMSFKEAIELDLLTDYKIITIEVNKSEISDFIKENNLIHLNDKWRKQTEARSLASMLALRKAMKEYPIKNAVSFHSTIEKAKRNKELQRYITDTYNYKPIDTYTVSGKDNTTKRNGIIQEFASSDSALITNAKCLTEGVDVPNIDCIVFADPRKSKVDIVQALGRALRKKKDKDWGYVILPVVYDEETEEIDNDNFNEILAVVRGLASNDERIIEYLKDKNQGEPKGNIDRDELFGFEVFSEYLNEEELTNDLQIKLWDKLAKLNWMPFQQARDLMHNMNFKSQDEYWKCHRENKLPKNIPFAAHSVYKNDGWVSYPDFLGYESLFREFRPFIDARHFVRKLNIRSYKKFRDYYSKNNLPNDIPLRPDSAYKNSGWKSWGDWLGTENVANYNRKYLDFQRAREIVHELGLKSMTEWREYCKSGNNRSDIPTYPNQTYKDWGWKGAGDWLGNGRIADQDKVYLSFEEAREFASSLGLSNATEWKSYVDENKIMNIPKKPNQTYRNLGWSGWGNFLDKRIKRKYDSYENAKRWANQNNILSKTEWKKSEKRPNIYPKNPDYAKEYRNDWEGWYPFLNTSKNYLPFKEAKNIVRKIKLKSQKEWREYCYKGIKPHNIPSSPERVYKNDGWKGIGDWLGTSTVAPQNKIFVSFLEARNFVRNLGLKGQADWRNYAKSGGNKPENIPYKPERTYKKEWKGWANFLGKD